MPWHIEQGGGTCAASEWAVIKDSDGSTAGCHGSKQEAQDQMAALYASENDARARADIRSGTVPSGAARSLAFPSRLEVRMVDRDGEQRHHVRGTASAYDQQYEMWDIFGPYTEGVRGGAGAASLASKPDVAFLVNHKGITMARTTNGSLVLAEGDGLNYDAYLNPKRQDVRDLVAAIEDGLITESSFAFMINRGTWNDDFTEYWIEEYDIDRGDVSAVNYGANPYTSVAARSREILADLAQLPDGARRAALERLRSDLGQPAPAAPQNGAGELVKTGRSVAMWQHMLLADDL